MAQLCEVARAVRDLIDRHRADHLPAHQRQQGAAPLRAAGRAGEQPGRHGAGQTRCAATGKGDAQAGHLDHDQEPAGRQGVPGLEPEQRREDHHRAVFAARPRAPDASRRRAPGRNSTTQSCASCATTRCWTGWPATAICWRRWTPTCPMPDRLTKYRSMRDASKTPEPVPAVKSVTGHNNTFVIQEHHARRLHYDFRLERDGVLVSWAVPKNLPETTVGQPPGGAHRGSSAGIRHVRGQHPQRRIRRRQGDHLGLGHLRHREVSRLRRKRRSHRQPARQPDLGPLRADTDQRRPVAGAPDEGPAGLRIRRDSHRCWPRTVRYRPEGRSVGVRRQVGRLPAAGRRRPRRHAASVAQRTRRHREYPQLRSLASRSGRPPRGTRRRGRRARRVGCAQLQRDAEPGPRHPRRVLGVRPALPRRPVAAAGQATAIGASCWKPWPAQAISSSPSCCPATAPRRSSTPASRAGRAWSPRDATPRYQPGRRSASWVKDKHWNTQEVVIGGWRAGEGGRSSGIGALLMGIPGAAVCISPVGSAPASPNASWPTSRRRWRRCTPTNRPSTPRCPRADAKGVTFVEPVLVGEVRYSEWTPDDRLRQSSWRGLRPDKKPSEVVRE